VDLGDNPAVQKDQTVSFGWGMVNQNIPYEPQVRRGRREGGEGTWVEISVDEVVFEDHLDERSGAQVRQHVLDLLVHIFSHEVRDGLTIVKCLPVQCEGEEGRGMEGPRQGHSHEHIQRSAQGK
jgi:hypothetical protein